MSDFANTLKKQELYSHTKIYVYMVVNIHVVFLSVMGPHILVRNKVLEKRVAISSVYHEDGSSMFLRNVGNKVPKFSTINVYMKETIFFHKYSFHLKKLIYFLLRFLQLQKNAHILCGSFKIITNYVLGYRISKFLRLLAISQLKLCFSLLRI